MTKASIYTRTGDRGRSQLLSVGRVSKAHKRLAAYGDIDELNSMVGLALAQGLDPQLGERLTAIQSLLFVLGSQIAVPNPEKAGFEIPRIESGHIERLEAWIDELDLDLPPLKNFILPGGTPGAASLHVARTICRRAERCIQGLAETEELAPEIGIFINRLSDYFFTAARWENRQKNVAEAGWTGT